MAAREGKERKNRRDVAERRSRFVSVEPGRRKRIRASVTSNSILYKSITQFSVETAGSFDADVELKIWVSGGGLPFTKELKRDTDGVGLQQYLAFCAFGSSIKG